MSLIKIIVVIAVIIFFLYMMRDNYPARTYVVPVVPQDEFVSNAPIRNDIPTQNDIITETFVEQTASNEFMPYTTQPNDSRYVLVPNLGVYLLPYEHLNLSIPYHQWMYSHFPSYYGEYYDNYWPFDESNGGAKYINSFN